MAVHVQIGSIWIDVSISETYALSAEVSDHPVERGVDVTDNIRPTPRTIRIEGLVTNHPIEQPQSHASGATINGTGYDIQVAANPLERVGPFSQKIKGEPITDAFTGIPGASQGLAIASAITGVLGVPLQLPRREYAAELYTVDPSSQTSMHVDALVFSEPFDRVSAVYDALCEVVQTAQPVQLVTGLDTFATVGLTDLSFERSAQTGGRKALKFTASCKVLRIVAAEAVPVPREQRGKPGESRGKQATTETDPNKLSDAAKAQLRASLLEKIKLGGWDEIKKLIPGFGG